MLSPWGLGNLHAESSGHAVKRGRVYPAAGAQRLSAAGRCRACHPLVQTAGFSLGEKPKYREGDVTVHYHFLLFYFKLTAF